MIYKFFSLLLYFKGHYGFILCFDKDMHGVTELYINKLVNYPTNTERQVFAKATSYLIIKLAS